MINPTYAGKPVRIARVVEDPFSYEVTVYLTNGKAVTTSNVNYQRGALNPWLEAMGALPSTERVDVIQYGRKVGELPAFWSPALAKSTSAFFDYRRGDLTFVDGKWHAHPSLGARDLDCLVGFVRKGAADDH